MTDLPAEVVGDAYTSTYAWSLLEDLVDIGNRMGGQKGEREGALRMRDAFEELGFRDVEVNEFEINGWWRGSSTLTLTGNNSATFEHQHDILALPGSPSGTVTTEIVDVGYGRSFDFEEADLDGKIAMASTETPEDVAAERGRWIHRMEKYTDAIDAGAAGFLFRNHVEGCLPPTGEIGYANRPGAIPAAGVSKELGERLRRNVERGGVTAELSIDARNEPTTSQNTEAVIGPDTEQEVLVTSHIDSHDIGNGARDNGVGSVLTAEIGRLLASVESDLESAVRLICFGCEEIGLKGSYHWVDTHDLDRVRVQHNIDGCGYGRTLRVNTHGFEAIERAANDVSDELEIPVSTFSLLRPHGDTWPFDEKGIPAVYARDEPDIGVSGRGWGHTHADTLDKLDIRDLRELAIGNTALAFKLTQDEYNPQHRTLEEVREMFDEKYENELRVSGRWRWDEE